MARGVERCSWSVSGEGMKVIKRKKEGQYDGRGREGVGRVEYLVKDGRENRNERL